MQAKIEPTTIRILRVGHEGKKITSRKTAPPPTEIGRLSLGEDQLLTHAQAGTGGRHAQVNSRHD